MTGVSQNEEATPEVMEKASKLWPEFNWKSFTGVDEDGIQTKYQPYWSKPYFSGIDWGIEQDTYTSQGKSLTTGSTMKNKFNRTIKLWIAEIVLFISGVLKSTSNWWGDQVTDQKWAYWVFGLPSMVLLLIVVVPFILMGIAWNSLVLWARKNSGEDYEYDGPE